MDADQLIDVWRRIICGPKKSWVVFRHGTCVFLMEPGSDLAEQAKDLLRRFGPVHGGGAAGDFSVATLPDGQGWVVSGHHHDILTYVAPDEVTGDAPGNLRVGLLGRSKRGWDAGELSAVHVEDNR